MLFSLLDNLFSMATSKRTSSNKFDSLVPAFINWKEIATTLSKGFNGFICIILMDDGEKSRLLIKYFQEYWYELNKVTGKNLIVFIPTFMPLSNSFNFEKEHPMRRISGIKDKNAECYWKSIVNPTKEFLFFFSKGFSEDFINQSDDIIELPSICILEFRETDEENSYYVDGSAFVIPLIFDKNGLISLFRGLGKMADASLTKKNKAKHFLKNVAYNPLYGLNTKLSLQSMKSFVQALIVARNKIKNIFGE